MPVMFGGRERDRGRHRERESDGTAREAPLWVLWAGLTWYAANATERRFLVSPRCAAANPVPSPGNHPDTRPEYQTLSTRVRDDFGRGGLDWFVRVFGKPLVANEGLRRGSLA
ncbi:hypothetical protein LX36DRAFT_654570 [Colletotrichum falcatum]|nr:hypothetical protein LX36DRAFT_654570 [Colletotrichum falcatum]